MAYLIGMHEFIDHDKYSRDFKDSIGGIEFCNFPDDEAAYQAVRFAKTKKTDFAVHFPISKTSYKFRDPHLTSHIIKEQDEAFEAIAKECSFAKEHGAIYLLIHFPKPIVLPKTGEFDGIGVPKDDYIYDDAVDYATFAKQCDRAIRFLSNLGEHYDMQIVLELDLMLPWLYETSLLEMLLVKFPNVKLCIDLARLHVQESMDKNFDATSFIKRYSPFTYVVHVSNIRVTHKLHERHYPALENVYEGEGWGNLTPMLEAFGTKPEHVLFEHKSDHLKEGELSSCYDYVMSHI